MPAWWLWICSPQLEVYRPRHLGSILTQGRRIGVAWTAVQALLATLATATGSTGELPWRFFLLWWAVGASGFVAVHAVVALVVARAQRSGRLATRLVLVGAGPQAAQFIRGLRQYDPAVVIVGHLR